GDRRAHRRRRRLVRDTVQGRLIRRPKPFLMTRRTPEPMPKTLEKKRGRPSWDEYFMQVANVVKSRSTCLSSAKGAVLVSGRQIISTGYNGTPAGTKHCDEGGCERCLAVKEGRLKSGQQL